MIIDKDKFETFFRYLVYVAQNKRVVMYHELENIFQLSHNTVGYYAAAVGDFCIENNLPLLNALIISATDCQPSFGFQPYLDDSEYDNWGDCLVSCWKTYHVTSSRKKQVENYQGLKDMMKLSDVI